MKFKSDIEVQAGLKDSSGAIGTSGQLLSSTATGVSWTSLNGFVPYTGANQNVDLGIYTLLAAKGVFSSSGSANTFEIGHSSGSGIALNIIKGGNGEGLYINKTSGTGNAATIIGTLNATTLVKSGGTAAQFLKADGTVDSTTYVPASRTITINGVTQDLSANRSFTVAGGVTSVFGRTGDVIAVSGDYNTSQVTENTNLYFTNARSRSAISLTTTGTSGAATYDSSTGVLNVPNYTFDPSGYLPLAGGTMTGNINWAQTDRGITWNFNTDGAYIKFFNTGNPDTDSRLEFATIDDNNEYFRWVHVPSGSAAYESMRLNPVSNGNAELIVTGKIIKAGGTTSQFLKANGDVDSTAYLPLAGGTMTGPITLVNGAVGIVVGDDATISDRNVANTIYVAGLQNTDRGYINFSETAGNQLGAVNGGSLTWRGDAVITTANISGNTNYIPKFTSANSIGNSSLQEANGNLGLGIAPSSWEIFKAINIGGSSISSNGSSSIILSRNWYFQSAEKYFENGTAQRIELVGNEFRFQTAVNNTSGAGAALTWNSPMSLSSTGNLLLNRADDAGFRLDVNGMGRFSDSVTANVVRSINGGVDAIFADAFVGVYSNNNNEQNSIQTAVSSAASQSGFRFQVSNGGGSAGRTNVVDFLRDRAIFNTNVGIGTSPAAKLDIRDDSGSVGTRIRVTNGSSAIFSSSGLELFSYNGSSVSIGTVLFNTNSNFNYGTISSNQTNLYGLRSGGIRIAAEVAPIIFSNGNGDSDFAIERMRIAPNGDVGIGTNGNYSSKLNVLISDATSTFAGVKTALRLMNDGSGRITKIILTDNTISDGTICFKPEGGGNSILSFGIQGTTVNYQTLNIRENGNVGIGTATAQLKATIRASDAPDLPTLGSASGHLLIGNGATNVDYGLMFGVNGYGDTWIQSQRVDGPATAYNILLQPRGGNVLIGTDTDSGYKLNVNGSGRFFMPSVSSSSPTLMLNQAGLYATVAGADQYHGMILRGIPSNFSNYAVTPGDYMSFYEYGGDFRFYKKDVFSLDLLARITSSGITATGFFNSSDIRLKELTPYDCNVSDIKPISYFWKDGRDDKKHIGYSAQEVQKVMPDAVNEGEDGMLSVNYIEVLVAKIAELENRIKQLEK
jgi:hypothetical protein